MILGWVAVVVGGLASVVFEYGPWFILGGFAVADVLRHLVQPCIPRKLERLRTWVLLTLGVLYMALLLLFDVQESPTHLLNIIGGMGFGFALIWLAWDDVRIYRLLLKSREANLENTRNARPEMNNFRSPKPW